MIVPNKKADGSFDQAIIQKTKVFIDAPRSQEKRTEFERQIAAANRLICDYTDGKFRFDKFQIVTHPAEKKKADIWWVQLQRPGLGPGRHLRSRARQADQVRRG